MKPFELTRSIFQVIVGLLVFAIATIYLMQAFFDPDQLWSTAKVIAFSTVVTSTYLTSLFLLSPYMFPKKEKERPAFTGRYQALNTRARKALARSNLSDNSSN